MPTENERALYWIDAYNGDSRQILMTEDEIRAENDRMTAQCAMMVDILDIPETYTQAELRAILTRAPAPSLPKYDDNGVEITGADVERLLENRNLDAVAEENPVLYGVAVSRANVRRFPTERSFYSALDNPYDRIQETELYVGMPLWILHTSLDGKYYFVQSYYYCGWVLAEDVAVTEDRDLWVKFAAPASFVTVIDALVEIEGEKYDMGAVLPLVHRAGNNVSVAVPVRSASGELTTKNTLVSAALVHVGYLPYTYANFVAQAFKYEGTMYGWGGLHDGVDCSSLVAAVFRVFGFRFPRDLGDQSGIVGSATAVSDRTAAEIAEALRNVTAPTAVYADGHAYLYLGEQNGAFSFLHAPSIGKAVQVTERTDLSGMRYLNEVCGRDA